MNMQTQCLSLALIILAVTALAFDLTVKGNM